MSENNDECLTAHGGVSGLFVLCNQIVPSSKILNKNKDNCILFFTLEKLALLIFSSLFDKLHRLKVQVIKQALDILSASCDLRTNVKQLGVSRGSWIIHEKDLEARPDLQRAQLCVTRLTRTHVAFKTPRPRARTIDLK